MAIRTIAKKEWRLLVRDPRASIVLLAMPFLFILVLGLSLGEGFGQKPDERLRVTLVDLDQGDTEPAVVYRNVMAYMSTVPQASGMAAAVPNSAWTALMFAVAGQATRFPQESWAKVVQRDLAETAGIRVEVIEEASADATLEEARYLVEHGKRSAILIFGPEFSKRVSQSSFLARGINPFYRDGVRLEELDADILRDPTQLTASSIIEQVAQVSLLRVILPWMIGRAFEKLGEPSFMTMLADEVPGGHLLPPSVKTSLGGGVQGALKRLFPKYNLTGKTWAALTKSDPRHGGGAAVTVYSGEGLGLPKRAEIRYQILVPSYTVTFAFFLVLTVGWLFVSERRQGTLKRLRAAPLTRTQILIGKLLPCFAISILQGLFLFVAGKLVFRMRWGPESWSVLEQLGWLVPVVVCTSFAAMGLALLIASLARTETQVAIYGTPLVLVLAGISGCLMPRDLMPEIMKRISLATPHAWAMDAYMQLLISPTPNILIVEQACLVLIAFGVGFLVLACTFLRLD
jgi:ABC-type multidrug transport system permease subunit